MAFVVNPTDPFLSPFSIRYLDLPTDAVPVRRRVGERGEIRVLGAVAAAALAVGIAIGLAAGNGGGAVAAGGSYGDPVRGEFVSGPGLQQPPGYVIPL